jgi:hypothetical protein
MDQGYLSVSGQKSTREKRSEFSQHIMIQFNGMIEPACQRLLYYCDFAC